MTGYVTREPARVICKLCGWQCDVPWATYRERVIQQRMDRQLAPHIREVPSHDEGVECPSVASVVFN